MIKKFLLACFAFLLTMGIAFAEVEVNKADQSALDGVKGIGPTISKAIIAERTKNGDFKDWADLQKRVKGIGDKNSSKLSQAGLVVNGQAKPGAPAAATAPASAASSAKAAAPAASASSSTPASALKK
ncbi:MAG TPA: helix-hairpin-helix domain-containing protein [Burkholderiaceae bacterium]